LALAWASGVLGGLLPATSQAQQASATPQYASIYDNDSSSSRGYAVEPVAYQSVDAGRSNDVEPQTMATPHSVIGGGVGFTLQDQTPNQPPAQDLDAVPVPPQTGDAQRPIGPPLVVQSNAQPESNFPQGNIPGWCDPCPPDEVFGCTPNGLCAGGWTQFGYHNRATPGFNNHPSELLWHQGWLFVERQAQATCNWNLGFRVDGLYGVDAQDVQAFGNPPTGAPDGWDNDWDHGTYGFAAPQAYVELGRYDWSIKAGHFFSPVNYEQVAAIDNFFYSHTLSFGLANPLTMSGVLAEYRGLGDVSVISGLATGWDTGYDRNDDGLVFVGGLRRCLSPNTVVSYMTSFGNTGYREDGYLHSLVLESRVGPRLTVATQSDFLELDNEEAFSWVNYAIFRPHPCLGVGARFEWYLSDQFTGNSDSTYNFTTGLNIRPHRNVTLRPELRFDWGTGAIDDGDPIAAIDAVVRY
jgi:hypothetical protein